ncbi:M20/M25/M40 family metallo-hydrolase [Nonomuraea sp. NPDC046570]|uniref:M20/M25/M40 family metallo-hydrolase n=1 Tax=Nonomuraea sp. NPDC046570 TaxID=3155255 RepID=UPI00340AAF84
MTGRLIGGSRLAAIAGLLALLGMITLTAMGESTMQPLPASASPQEFSSARALAHLERFATEPRPLGSPASDRARDYLVAQLRSAGLTVEVQRAVGVRPAAGLATFGRVDNIVATLPGTAPTGTVLVAAHYDSAAMGPGASDDGAAVAAMLETVRALRTEGGLRNDVVFLMTDGEEDGVLGAEAFVREHPLAGEGGVLLNWEARGVAGPSLMFETSRDNARLVEMFASAVPHPRGDSSMVELYRLLPNNTDFTPLTKAGFAGMNFAYIERSSRYHTADDSIAYLDRGSLQHHGSNMLAMTRALGGADLPGLAAEHDVTYFRAFGVMITYPGHLVWPLAVLAVLALAGLTVCARRVASVPRVIVGAVSAVVPLIVSVVLAQGLWELLVAWRPAYDAMGGLLHRPLAYQAAIAAMSGVALLGWYLSLRRRLGAAALAIGALVWPTALGVLCAPYAPGASFVFTLPALLCAVGGLVSLTLPPRWQAVAMTIGTAASAALLPALAGNALDGMGLALGGGAALILTLFGLTLLPLAELLLPSRQPLFQVMSSIGLVCALIGLGLATDRFDTNHPERTHLAYVLNADTREAHWVTADAEPPAWTRTYVSSRDVRDLPAGYARGHRWSGPAQPVKAAEPRVSVLARNGDTLTLRVRAGRGARSVILRLNQAITEASATVDGLKPVTTPITGVRANTWPSEIRFRDLPARGVQVTVRVSGTARLQVTAIAETPGLSAVPGFVPKPPEVVTSTREDGDLIAVTRTYDL